MQAVANPYFVPEGTTLPLAGNENVLLLQGQFLTQCDLNDAVMATVLTNFGQILTTLTTGANLTALVSAITTGTNLDTIVNALSTSPHLVTLINAITAAGLISVSSSPYTLSVSGARMILVRAVPMAITLAPTLMVAGQEIVIADTTGSASTSTPITVLPGGSAKINTDTSLVMDVAFDATRLVFDGTNFRTIT